MRVLKAEGYEELVGVAGFEDVQIIDSNEVLMKIGSSCYMDVQLLSPEYVAGIEHIYFASLNVLRAFKQGSRISRSRAVELLTYVSGQRQIEKAISHLGIKDDQKKVVVAVIGLREDQIVDCVMTAAKHIGGRMDDSVIEIDSKMKLSAIKRFFQISQKEIEAVRKPKEDEVEIVKKLVIERMAILATLV
jgi:tRNA threonylcarbamoyladenosine modification (KEOPS) complex Cgi121 subunit